jgi:hypothetical protein
MHRFPTLDEREFGVSPPCKEQNSLLGEGVEGGAEAFEAAAERGRVAANADAEMPRHLEEATGNNGGFIFLAKQFEEALGITTVREAREDHRTSGRAKAFEVAARIEEGIEQGAIGCQERLGARAKLFEMMEGHHRQALGGMGGDGSKEIVEKPHAAGKVGRGENPAAAQTAQAINFREAAGDDEGILIGRDGITDSKAKRSSIAKKHFEIDLIDEHTDSGAVRNPANGAKHFHGE